MSFKTVSVLLMMVMSAAAFADSDAYLYETADGSRLDAMDQRLLSSLKKESKRALDGNSYNPGEVVFSFGGGHHSVVCAVLELCDIALEAGEKILDAQIGDSARWSVDTASSGSGSMRVQHLVVKPLSSDIHTSLVVTTDRRTYHLRLKASSDQFMPSVRFSYPGSGFSVLNDSRHNDSPVSRLSFNGNDSYQNNSVFRSEAETSDDSADSETLHDSDFEITGDEEAMPERVFFDGRRTIVRMATGTLPMPVLLLPGNSANYRVKGNDYIIDGRLKTCSLILKDGDQTYKTEITHVG